MPNLFIMVILLESWSSKYIPVVLIIGWTIKNKSIVSII